MCRVARSLARSPLHSASSLGALSPRSTNPVTATSRPPFTLRSRPRCQSGHVPRPGPARATWQPPPPAAARLLAHPAPATGPAWTQHIPPGSGIYHRPTPLGDRSQQGATLGSSRLGFPYGFLLLRRDCLPDRLPQRDRPGRNSSPQDLEPITVRLPSGIGHGKGPCSAQADLVFPKVVPVTPPVALTDNRSRRGP